MNNDLIRFVRNCLDHDQAEIEKDDRHWSEVPYEACSARRLLAEVDAKRRIIAEYVRWAEANSSPGIPDSVDAGQEYGLEFAVRCLAVPHSDHPDYREEWRP